MTMRNALLVLAVALCVSCAESEDAYKVGDYYENGTVRGIVYRADGSHGMVVSLEELQTEWQKGSFPCPALTSPNGATNVSVLETYLSACRQATPESLDSALKMVLGEAFETLSESEKTKLSGELAESADWNWASEFAAAGWCAEQGEGWYLPSVAELQELYKAFNGSGAVSDENRRKFNAVIAEHGGVPMKDAGGVYLSSNYTGSVLSDSRTDLSPTSVGGVSMDFGYESYYQVDVPHYVRAVHAF